MTHPGDLPEQAASAARHNLDWLSGGGEMGKLIRSMDWAQTPLGPFEDWPQSLRTTVSLCLSSTFPILIAWGPERVQIYNDSYRPIAGAKHPQSMGQRFNDCWASALPAVGAVVDRAQAGEGSYIENLQMFLDRHGYLEEAFMTFSFSPIRDETGRVGGLFHPITEVTDKMLGTRRTQTLRELAAQLGQAKTMDAAWAFAARSCEASPLDLPFLLFYRLDEGATQATLAGTAGLAPGTPAAPDRIDLAGPEAPFWPLQRALASRQVVEAERLPWGAQTCGPYEEPPTAALVLPVQPSGAPAPIGFLVAGVSARRALDAPYRAFYETLAATFTTALTSVRAYEHEQRRAEELAALDRAKTTFFSNVSHEFRTPLTLILGPTEEAMSSPDRALRGNDLATVYRNELRLLKLVNTLLDFSRIEAGRVQASYEPTDLATLTADLASAFRSLVERAGLALVVDCPPLSGPVYVDHEMWEKIVLNLLSNAFKFTFKGQIMVRLREVEGRIELSVADTGIGIPEAELPRVFERFHRVEGTRGRSYEGTGIGLALVQELARLHGGALRVASAVGQGTVFTVELRPGSDHLPADRVQADRSLATTATRAEAFVREAAAWLDEPPSGELATPTSQGQSLVAPAPHASQGRVLVADDNADMRDYVRRLLASRFTVATVADGLAALEAVRAHPPDLLVSDVMMPGLDGFALLRALKDDPLTAGVPVILLSARAGEEARVEGLAAGAIDYMVKPFAARELVARVEGSIQLARARARQADFEQQLVGIVSHDLRTPLTSIHLAASLLLQPVPHDEATTRRLAGRIRTSADRAGRMVRDLLDFTQARLGGGIPVTPTPLDLHATVRQVLEEVQASFPGRALSIKTHGDARGAWDADRLAQVISNLASNAFTYSPPGSTVSVSTRGRDGDVELRVHNAGDPIPPDALGRLFEPMQRAALQADKAGRSVGLGLYIVRHIVDRHGGTINVESTATTGTTFTVRLPRQTLAR